MNTLHIENISKIYPNGVTALDHVSLTLNNGMFGLLGANGAGKSTLMRTIATLQEPDSGSITFNGEDILKYPQSVRSCLGYLPQEFGVYPKISAVELLDHIAVLKGLLNRKEREEQIRQLLLQTNLYPHRKKHVASYSGGMKQRFGIAQALLGNPKLIIVDEPTAGLDPEERHRFLNLLSEIGENIIVILSTHIVADIYELCSSMAVLSEGKLLKQGKPTELVAPLKGKVWSKVIEKKQLPEYQDKYTVISTRLIAGQTLIQIVSDKKPEEGFEPKPPTLEDFYFLLTTQTNTSNTSTPDL